MGMRISLRDVNAENWEEVIELEVTDEQEDYLASNLYSLAESKYNPYAVPMAIYAGKRMVGFLMYESLTDDGEPHAYSLYRFMIDERYQGKGYGRASLLALLKHIGKRDTRLTRITVCYEPENTPAKKLYASLGFREIGLDEDDEMIAEIRYDR